MCCRRCCEESEDAERATEGCPADPSPAICRADDDGRSNNALATSDFTLYMDLHARRVCCILRGSIQAICCWPQQAIVIAAL
jgi:hypothetical protein